jgi:hypothetical protein
MFAIVRFGTQGKIDTGQMSSNSAGSRYATRVPLWLLSGRLRIATPETDAQQVA